MSAESREPTALDPSAPVAPPELREARFDDFPAIHRLESRFFFGSLAPADRQRLFEDNPLWPRLKTNWPLGWVLEDAGGTIVGSVSNFPSLYLYRGQEKICANGHAWVAAPEHRGYATLLMDEYFHQDGADLYISSLVGVDATPLWRAYASPVPVGDWSRIAYAVTHRRAFVRTVLAMKGVPAARALSVPAAAALRVRESLTSRSLPPAPDDVEIVESRTFDDRFDDFWEELRTQNTDVLFGVRDRRTLDWHFGVPRRCGGLWVYTASRNGRIRAYCVTKRHERAQGIRSMKIVDYQTVDTDTDLLPGLVRAAMARCAREGITVIEHHGTGIPKMRSFEDFAPYHAEKPRWSFYFGATEPALVSELMAPELWDPSEYDGDASFR